MKVEKDTSLKDILDLPQGEEILTKHGVPCVTCPMAKFEISKLKLEDVCDMYGLDLEAILGDLKVEKKASK